MKCQNCRLNEANVNHDMNINNQRMLVHLCDSCFQDIQGQMMNSNDFFKGSPFENNNMNNKYFNGQGNKGTSTQTKERENNQRDGLLDQLGNNISDQARAGNIDP